MAEETNNTAMIQIDEKSIRGLFPESPDAFERLIKAYGVKEIKLWIGCKGKIKIRNILKRLPVTKLNFSHYFSTETMPSDFNGNDFCIMTITNDAATFKMMVEETAATNPMNRFNIYVGTINDQIRKLMVSMVGNNGKFLHFDTNMEVAIERSCRYIINQRL